MSVLLYKGSIEKIRAGAPLRRILFNLALLSSFSLCFASCSSGSSGYISTSATFPNVGDLIVGAPVQFDDIDVGHVSAIELVGNDALVKMSIRKSSHIPANVMAELVRTTVLGQKIIALVPVSNFSYTQALLSNGVRIEKTKVVPGIQQFLQAGAGVFGAINTQELAQIVATGAQGFGGQGSTLHQLLDSFENVANGYAGQTGSIQQLVNGMDQLSVTLAPNSLSDAQALSNFSDTTAVLAKESNDFNTLIQSLNDLSVQGKSILGNYSADINTQLQELYSLSSILASKQYELGDIIANLPKYETDISSVVKDRYLQLVSTLILCGVPGGGSSSHGASSC